MRTVLIRDLIGTQPLTIDQRSRNADGSLKYPEQQKTPRITTLQRVWTARKDGQTWLCWEWDSNFPETFCHSSGVVLTSEHADNYALEVQS